MTPLAAARAALRAELGYVPMTTSTVPSQTETVGGIEVTDSGPLGGPALSPSFARYLDGQFGSSYPFAAALASLRHDCRRRHVGHTDRDEWRGSLCHRLVMLTVHECFSPAFAARACGIDLAAAERLLFGKPDKEGELHGGALRTISEHMAARAPRPTVTEPEQMTPSRLSRAICDALQREVRDFDLEQRIWEAFRYRDPTLPAWDVEWGRRQAKWLEHRPTCERCRYEAAA